MGAVFLFGIYWTISLSMKTFEQEKEAQIKREELYANVSVGEKLVEISIKRCPSGFLYKLGNCYRFHAKGENWLMSNRTCEWAGSYLAVPKSEVERSYFMALFASYPPDHIDHYTEGQSKSNLFKPNYVAVGIYYDMDPNVNAWVTTERKTIRENNFPRDWHPKNQTVIWFYASPCYGFMRRDGVFMNFNEYHISPFICQRPSM